MGIIVGVFAGLFGGCFLKCLSETRASKNIETCLKVPLLGTIPTIDKNAPEVTQAFKNTKEKIASFFSEDKNINSLVITGTAAGEGSSFIAAKLAIAFAAEGKSVLLIDADLRQGRLAQAFGVSNKVGLTDVIAGLRPLQESIVSTGVPNLFLLSCGVEVSDVAGLLDAKKVEQVLKQAKQKFKIVIIDSSPILNVTDTRIITKASDGIVFVAKPRKTRLKRLLEAKKIAEKNAVVVGVILNEGGGKKTVSNNSKI